MLSKIVDYVIGLLSGKGGTTQIGSRNTSTTNTQSISGITVGDGARDVTIANTSNHFSSPPNDKHQTFEPTAEEAEIIKALSQPGAFPLLRVKADCQSQYILLINYEEAANPHTDTDGCYRYLDALRRLQQYDLLVDDTGEGESFRLSQNGRIIAMQIATLTN